MSWAVTNIASSVAGTKQAERTQIKENARQEQPRKPRALRDEFQPTEAVEHAAAVRSLKDNSQEEAHEDRQQHAGDFERPGLQEAADRHEASSAQQAYQQPIRPQSSRLDIDA